jgi:hypothetical protein
MEEHRSRDSALVFVRFRIADEHPFRRLPGFHFLECQSFAGVHDDLLAGCENLAR